MGWSIDEIKEAMEKFMKQKVPVSYPVGQILYPLAYFSAGNKDLTPQRVSKGPLTIGIVQGACELVVSVALVQHGGS